MSLEVLSVLEPVVATIGVMLKRVLDSEALAHSERLHGALLSSMSEAVAYCRLLYDEEGAVRDWVFLNVNEPFAALFGISDPVGQHGSEIYEGMGSWASTILETSARVVATGDAERIEAYLPSIGKWLDLKIASPVPDHVLAVFDDVSERKQVEESLRATQLSVDQAPEMVLWTDETGRIVYANEAVSRILGYEKQEMETLYLWDLDRDLEPEQFRQRWEEARDSGKPFYAERVFEGKDGQKHSVELSSTQLELQDRLLAVTFARDITERKRLEESLYLTQVSVDHAADMIHWMDAEGRLIYVNQFTADSLGYERDEMSRMHLWDIAPEITPEFFVDRWHEGEGRPPIVHESLMRAKDGRLIPVEVTTTRAEFAGKAVGVSVARDISERKRLEQSLRLTQCSVDQASDMIFWLDSDGRYVFANEAACRTSGYSLDQITDKHLWDLDPTLTEAQWSEIWRVMKEEGPQTVETVNKASDGREYPVEVSSQYLVFEDKEYAVSFTRDNTERKRAEQSLRDSEKRYRHLFDLNSDAHLLVDDESFRILEANEAAVELFGYSRPELLDMTIFRLSDNPELPKTISRVPEIEVPLVWHRKKDGTVFPVEIRGRRFDWKDRAVRVVAIRDISERKQTEESLLLTRYAVQQADDIVYWVDPEGRFLYTNWSTSKLLGYSHEELERMHAWDIVHEGVPEGFRQRWASVRASGSVRSESTFVDKQGRTFPVEISSNFFEYEGREFGVSFAREIGERKEREQLLRDSEERYRQLFELETDALVLAEDDSGRILEINQAAADLYGYSRTELLAMKDTQLLAEASETERAKEESLGGAALHYHRTKDGTIFPVEVRGRHFEWKGRPVHVTAVRDITLRKRAEDDLEESRRMMRLVLDTVPLRIAWRDRDLRYLGCNVAVALDAHLPDTASIVGLRDEDLPHCTASPESLESDREVIATGVPKLQYDETMVTVDGPARVMRTSKVPLRDRSDNVIGVLSIREDITERVRTMEALRDREEQLRQSQKMEAVGRLAGGIAHDFNNVLTTIIGYSDLLLSTEEFDAAALREDLAEIKAAAERASNLTRQILAFSRRQALEPQVLFLNRVIEQTERLLARTIGADVELKTVLSPDLGLVEVDEHQLVQVLLNLAVNARDAMPEGGVLTIATENATLDEGFCQIHPDAHPGNYIVVSVIDTGVGMDADTATHVFEPFYTTKATGQGTGLGLATVYGVVTQSGGCVALESELGQGTTFRIYLPRFDHPGIKTEAEAPDGAPVTERKVILVVDDDSTFRSLTVRILEKRGYRVIAAGDGDRAVEILQNKDAPVDLLLTDVVMPGSLHGGQIGQMASSLRPGLPVLYMSAYTRETIVQAGRIQEDVDFLEKPFTAEHLVSRVRELLDRHRES